MSQIKLFKMKSDVSYPIEEYVNDFISLITEIDERQKRMYSVPYEELDSLSIELDSYPEENIEKFNEKYAYVQSLYFRVSFVLMEIKKELKDWNFLKSKVMTLYRRAKNLLLISKPDIKNLRNKELQEAAIQLELSDIVDVLESVDSVIQSLKFDFDIVSLKLDALDKANLNLNRQQKILEDEIMLGLLKRQ
jgi:hypothetical protein